MKKFTFQLQKILDLRVFYEDQAKNELAAAVSRVEMLRRELEEAGLAKQNAGKMRSGASLYDLQTIELFITRIAVRIEQLLEEIAQAELIVEQKRAAYTDALKNRKVISNLRENKRLEFKKDEQKEQDTIVDDLVTGRYKPAGS